MELTPPAPMRIEVVHERHGDRRPDPYMWMHDRNAPKVLEHLKAENAYTQAVLEPYAALRTTLLGELRSRIVEEDQTVPVSLRGYSYYARMVKGGEYPLFCRRKESPGNSLGSEEILVDGNKEGAGHEYLGLTRVSPSPDNEHFVYGLDTVGRRFYDLRIMKAGDRAKAGASHELVRTVPQTTGNFAWAEDNRTLFFVTQDKETLRADTVWSIDMHTGAKRKVYFEADETFSVSVSKTRTNRLILIDLQSTLTTEVRYLPADQPGAEPSIFSPRQRGHEYSVEDGADAFFILTNDGARNFRVMTTSRQNTAKAAWKERIATQDQVLIEGLSVFQDFFVLSEMTEGRSSLRIVPHTGEPYPIVFADPAYIAAPDSNPNFVTQEYRFSYESLIRPPSVFAHELATKNNRLLKQKEVPGYDPNHYTSERVLVKSHDGEQVPLLLAYRRDAMQKTGQPALLYGYGAYGISTEADFSASAVSLMDRGFVYALAQVRGGSERGRRWYEQGRQLAKINSFKDFIACGDYLRNTGMTKGGHVYAWGGSAGGLLVGAAMNMRPDLFHGVIAAVPFVDVLTTMLDDSIPLTTGEYDEWGNPNDKTFYEAMRAYSPYDNVARKNYPAVFISSGFHDSQVQYWEPTKWAAKLRDHTTSNQPILLWTHLEAGHGGASGRYKALEDTAREHTFVLMLQGPQFQQPRPFAQAPEQKTAP